MSIEIDGLERVAVLRSGSAPPDLAPVSKSERIASLDVLRGVALLGILVMNINSFGLPHWAYWDPTVYGGDGSLDLGTWFAQDVLFNGKMRALFSMLFGAGVILFTSRPRRGDELADVYYRRTLWLIAFGLVHAYILLWPGDILYKYGICGLVLFPFRKLGAGKLIAVGVACLLVLTPKGLWSDFETAAEHRAALEVEEALAASGSAPTTDQQEVLDGWASSLAESRPSPEAVRAELELVRGAYVPLFVEFTGVIAGIQSEGLYHSFWDAIGMMFIGMGLLKLGVLSGKRPRHDYVRLAACGYGIGLPLAGWLAYGWAAKGFPAVDFSTDVQWSVGYQLSRLAVGLGHVACILLVLQSGIAAALMRRIAAVGQMALTNYLFHTLACTLLFHGYGAGLFGYFSRFQLLAIVVLVWAFQLVASPIWLHYFRFGPAEWLWRSLTYWQLQPMRRVPAAAAA